jgi:outer membrane lipoprotein-sorting protein
MIRHAQVAFFLGICLLFAAPVWGGEHLLLRTMAERFDALTNYTTLLDSEGEDGRNRIVYTYKKPGFIRMDFVRPHKGARLIYNPVKNEVSLRPFSSKLITLNLSPDNRLITDPKGHTVDRSDIGALIGSATRYAQEGTVTSLPPEWVETHLCPRLMIESEKVTYLLWVHPELYLPIKVVKLFPGGTQETVFLRNLIVDGPLDDTAFKQ